MNRRILALSGLIAIIAGTTYGVQAQTPPPAPPVGSSPIKRLKEPHPEIRMALRALNKAMNDLKKADHDFSGHREKALDLTQQAIAECKAALQADKH